MLFPRRLAKLTAILSLMTGIFVSGTPVAPAAPGSAQRVFTLEEATIADITAAFDAGALTCQQLTRLYLNRIAAYDQAGPKINSIITVNPRAMEAAAELDAERAATGPRSRLHCIPIVLKDNVDTYDMPTSNGSVILKNAIAPDDAHLAHELRSAGALLLGKAAMGEFAGGSYNSVTGQTLNPYHLGRATGGSSAGSGAAIAANLAVLAIGTDTSTSVRGPSSYNGIVGLRPTTGLVSRDGVAPKNLNFDATGPMARTVTDLATMLTFVGTPDPSDFMNRRVFEASPHQIGMDYTQFLRRDALQGARIGVLREYFGGDPEIDALAEAAIAKMRELGAVIVDNVTVDPVFREDFSTVRRISDYRFKDDWEEYLATFGPEIPKTVEEFIRIYETEVKFSEFPVEDSVVDLLRRSLAVSTDDPVYQNLINNVLPAATAKKLAMFAAHDLDAVVFPYVPTFAMPITNPVYSIEDPTFVNSNLPVPATMAGYSSIGSPALVVPMGFGTQGLPMTISFMGRPFDEGKIIGYGYAYEQASMMRRPSPLVPPLPGETIPY
jgi:amidase